jgi:hypothetical protein
VTDVTISWGDYQSLQAFIALAIFVAIPIAIAGTVEAIEEYMEK